MARLPLILSAHSSARQADRGQGRREAGETSALSCQFCGQPTASWQDDSGDDCTHICPLCQLGLNLTRPEIDREAALIWLPEMTQTALNLLVREIHLLCCREDASPRFAPTPQIDITARRARDAHTAYRALHERSKAAERRLGTTSPARLGLALLDLSPADYDRRAELLAGTRLLPLGQFFADGRDIYPDLLRAWIAGADDNRSTAS